MSASANLALPFIEGGELLPDVTLNETLRLIDTLVQLAIVDRDLNAPPGSPSEGQRWIVKASPSPTGAWAGHGNHIAAWQDGGWVFCTPQTGWFAYVIDEGALIAWSGSAWVNALATLTSFQNLSLLGVGTTADATNPLSAKLNNALWVAKTVAEGGDGNLRYKLSKESSAKTLSLLFQDNFSGRAEIGLTGDDDFHFKVSPDGSTWYEGIRIDKSSGKVVFPASGGPRETLGADRTYYVRTDGSDANTGLANTAGGAFLTIQKAIDAVCALDTSIYQVTIQVGSGTFTGALALKPTLGALPPILLGDTSTPANVVISVTGAAQAVLIDNASWVVRGFKIQTATSGDAIKAQNGAVLTLGTVNFGALAASGIHLNVLKGSVVTIDSSYTISGGADRHYSVQYNSFLTTRVLTVTLTGTPAFATAFAFVNMAATVDAVFMTFSGAATGKRYDVQTNGVVDTFGGGASYFPGNSAGSTATGGQYA